MNLTRRDLAKLALAALPAPALFAKPNSKFGGVQIGINAPYSFHGLPDDAGSVLKDLIQLDLSAVELRSQPVEQAFGAPVAPRGLNLTPEQKAVADALQKWRLSAPLSQFRDFRKKWEEAGVRIEIVKFDGVESMSDDVADYAFEFAKVLGAHAISCEIPVSRTRWFGQFAAKHKMMVGYHGHTNITDPEAFGRPESWETAMSYSKYNGINLDIGHFVAGNSRSPVEFLKKYADRVTHIHLKDRKLHGGPNTVWGQGDTPIKEVLQLMKTQKYPFQGTIEFEYKVPDGSDVMKEIARCVEFCRAALA
ncbi:MAG: sugar phosphate isomerase/epimerase [Bryobacteraceae bacterium]|nr:sugar phosphate isomerase/epimerase [Bryobacteraceae bacterium]